MMTYHLTGRKQSNHGVVPITPYTDVEWTEFDGFNKHKDEEQTSHRSVDDLAIALTVTKSGMMCYISDRCQFQRENRGRAINDDPEGSLPSFGEVADILNVRFSGIDERLREIRLAQAELQRVGVEMEDLVAGGATVIGLLVEVIRQVIEKKDIVPGGARGIDLLAVQRQLVETKELAAAGAREIDLLEDIKRVVVEAKDLMAGGATGIDLLVATGLGLRAEPIDAPRRACVLPSWEFALEQGLSDEEQEPDA